MASFVVTVTDPCLTGPAITQQAVSATQYTIGQSADTITIPYFVSTVETATSNAGACGPIETEFYLQDANSVYYPLNYTEYPYLSYADDGTNHVLTV
jgi:hypothetical protein